MLMMSMVNPFSKMDKREIEITLFGDISKTGNEIQKVSTIIFLLLHL